MEFSLIFGTLLLFMCTTSICLTGYLWMTLTKERRLKEGHKHREPRSDTLQRAEDNHVQRITGNQRGSYQRKLKEQQRQLMQWNQKEKQRLEEQRKLEEKQRQEKERKRRENRKIEEEKRREKQQKLEEKRKRHEQEMRKLEEKSRQKEERRQEEERKRNEKLLKLEAERRQKEKLQEEFERKRQEQFGLGELHTRRKERDLEQRCEQRRTVDFNEERGLKEQWKFEEEHPCKTTRVRRALWEIAETYVPPKTENVRDDPHINERPRSYQEENNLWRVHGSQNNEKTETLLKIGGGVLACAGLLLSAKIRAIATVGTVTYQAYTAYKAMNDRPKTPRYYS